LTAMIEIIISLVLLSYALAALLYWWGTKGGPKINKIAFCLAAIGCMLNFLVLIMRSIMTGRLPLSNGGEFLLGFTWITVVGCLLLELRKQIKGTGGIVMLMAALFTLAVLILMKGQYSETSPLMPALKSPWLTVHVLTVALAYAGFTLAAGLAFRQFFQTRPSREDDRIYQIVAASFTLLSLSIVLGAIWAEQAWGSYWTWDPKETWAFITWIIYALYLHLHHKRSWSGEAARLMVILGFLLVLFTFFGVNFLMSGLHSYA